MSMELDISSKEQHWQIEADLDKALVDGEDHSYDIKKIGDGSFHMILKNKSYVIDVIKYQKDEKKLQLMVNGTPYEYEIKDRYDQLLEKLGFDSMAGAGLSEIKAPMPGLVLDILIEPGQALQEGESMVILEAMKMENILKAPGEATVKDIKVAKGDTVDKNQILIRFE